MVQWYGDTASWWHTITVAQRHGGTPSRWHSIMVTQRHGGTDTWWNSIMVAQHQYRMGLWQHGDMWWTLITTLPLSPSWVVVPTWIRFVSRCRCVLLQLQSWCGGTIQPLPVTPHTSQRPAWHSVWQDLTADLLVESVIILSNSGDFLLRWMSSRIYNSYSHICVSFSEENSF